MADRIESQNERLRVPSKFRFWRSRHSSIQLIRLHSNTLYIHSPWIQRYSYEKNSPLQINVPNEFQVNKTFERAYKYS